MSTDEKFYPGKNSKNDSNPYVAPVQPPLLPIDQSGTTVNPLERVDLNGVQPYPDGDAGPRGAIRFSEEIRQSGFAQGSPGYEDFVLRMKADPADQEYSSLVQKEQDAVKKTILDRERTQGGSTGGNGFSMSGAGEGLLAGAQQGYSQAQLASGHSGAPIQQVQDPKHPKQTKPIYAASSQEEAAMDRDQKRQTHTYVGPNVVFVNSYGSATDADKQSLQQTPKPGSQSADVANDNSNGPDYESITDQEYIQAGGAVWVGDQQTTNATTGTTGNQGVYRNAQDMMGDVYRWDTGQTAAFQKKMGLPVTGVADDKTVTVWKWAINTARYYTAMGQKRSVDMILQQGKASMGGGGGGGGGGAGAQVPADAAKRLLNEAMKQYAGREATPDELKQFLPAVRAAAGSSDFDATQFTTDWIRGGSNGARSTEVGNFQAATDYYSVVQQLIGGR